MKLHVTISHIWFAFSYHTRCVCTDFEEISRFAKVSKSVLDDFLVSRGCIRNSVFVISHNILSYEITKYNITKYNTPTVEAPTTPGTMDRRKPYLVGSRGGIPGLKNESQEFSSVRVG